MLVMKAKNKIKMNILKGLYFSRDTAIQNQY